MCIQYIGRDDREAKQCGRHSVNCVHVQFWNFVGYGMHWNVQDAPQLCLECIF